MKPNLVRWHKDYAEKGLVVIDIDDGSADTMDALKKNVEKGEVKFPVLWDKEGKNCEKYGIKAFPSAYLVGVDGKVLWEGFPNPEVEAIEKLIKAELEKVKK
jgi:peroxiredoxin